MFPIYDGVLQVKQGGGKSRRQWPLPASSRLRSEITEYSTSFEPRTAEGR